MDYYHPQEDHSNMLPLVSGQHHQQQPPLIQSPAIPAPSSAPVSSASSAADDAVLLAMSDFSTYQHFNQFQFNDSLSGPLHTSPAPVQQILSDHTVSVAPTQEQPQHVSWRHTQQQIQQQLAQQRRDSLIYQQQQQQRQQQQQAVRTMHQPQMYLPRQLSVSQIPTSFQNTVVHPAPTRQQQQQQQLPSSQHHALPQQHLPRTSPVYQQYYSLVDLNGASSIGPMTHQPFSASSNLTLPATTGSPAHTNFSYQQHYTNGYPGLMPHSSPIPSMAHYPYPQQQHLDSTPNQKKRKGGDLEEYVHEFPAPKKKTKTKKKRAKQPAEPVDPNAPPKPKRKTGLNKPLILSAALSAFVGGDTEVKGGWTLMHKDRQAHGLTVLIVVATWNCEKAMEVYQRQWPPGSSGPPIHPVWWKAKDYLWPRQNQQLRHEQGPLRSSD